jgi:hypothetical protein
MGIGLRIFIVNDDGTLKRLALARYERLVQGDTNERLVEYAGKRVRYALIAVDFVNRRPVGVLHTEYGVLHFDSKGHIDANEREKEGKLGVEMAPPLLPDSYPRKVIDAHHRFARKRYEAKYKWTPSPEIVEAIMKAIFGKG